MNWPDDYINKIICGDCLEVMQGIPDGAVDCVITDPPYESEAHTQQRRVKRGSHSRGVDDREAKNQPLSFEPLSFETREISGREIARLCKKWAVVFCQCEASQLWRSALEPMKYKRTGVWVKPDAMPQYSGDRPGMGYESIVFCHSNGKSRWNGGGRVGVFIHNKNSVGKHVHETQKPLTLMSELIYLFTNETDIILDPFCGSGTTCVAAKQMGRKYIGIEISPEYAAIAQRRVDSVGHQKELF